MARRCSICDHPNLEEIDRRLIIGDSIAEIAQKYALSWNSVDRHKKNHLPATLKPSYSAQEICRADNLLSELNSIRERTLKLLDRCESENELKVIPSYLREFREQIRILAELEGKLIAQPQINLTQLNIFDSPQWGAVGDLLIQVLEPFPDLRAKVAQGLLELAEGNRDE